MRFLLLSVVVTVLASPGVRGQASNEFLRTNPKFLAAFGDVAAKVSRATVRVQVDDKDVCLGVIVGADGWILTKAHDLKGKIRCIMHDGRKLDARLVGVHTPDDLAMLKVSARSLDAVKLTSSSVAKPGAWVASIGMTKLPVAVGVVGAPARKTRDAYLGVLVETTPSGLIVLNIAEKSAAFKVGLKPKDYLLQIDKRKIADADGLMDVLSDYRPGDAITLKIRREMKELTMKLILQSRDEVGDFRAEFQNRLGSELSTRRSGYGVILQHDSVVKPADCGGPIVDLKGRVIGINISRAGRVETWAIPSEVIQPLMSELKSGRLAPK